MTAERTRESPLRREIERQRAEVARLQRLYKRFTERQLSRAAARNEPVPCPWCEHPDASANFADEARLCRECAEVLEAHLRERGFRA